MTGYWGRRCIGMMGYWSRIAGEAARGLSVCRVERCEAYQSIGVSVRCLSVRRAVTCLFVVGVAGVSARGLVGSGGSTVPATVVF